jgi:hypothetical protein
VIIYESKKIHPNLITTSMNQIHKDIKLNPTHEDNGQIHFLGLLLIQKPSKIKTDIFQTPEQIQLLISSRTTPQNIL